MSLEPLAATYAPPTASFDFRDPDGNEAVERYFVGFPRNEAANREEADVLYAAHTALNADEQRIVSSVHKLLFDAVEESGLGRGSRTRTGTRVTFISGICTTGPGVPTGTIRRRSSRTCCTTGLIRTNQRDAVKARAG